MIRLVDYIRQIFCKHDYHVETYYCIDKELGLSGDKVYMRCNKCGYNKNHWKIW